MRAPRIAIVGGGVGGLAAAFTHHANYLLDITDQSPRSPDWLKMKNPTCAAVKREAEEDWGR